MVPEAPVQDSHDRPGSIGRFAEVLRTPDSWRFTSVGFVARLPLSMIGLGIVFLVTASGGSYTQAGVLTATFSLAAAFIGPFASRLLDRYGQHRILPWLAAGQVTGLLLFVAGVNQSWPTPVLFALATFAGGVAPNIGSLVRARWIHLVGGKQSLQTALAWESILDEVIFIVGPPLATVLSVQVAAAAPLVISAVLAGAGGLALSRMRATDPGPQQNATRARGHALMLPGMAMLTLVMMLLGSMFGALEISAVAFAQDSGVPAAAGLILSLYALGSLMGGVALGSMPPPASQSRRLRSTAAILAVVSFPLWLVDNVWLLAGLAFGSGLAVAPVLITAIALVERLVPTTRITEALTVTNSGLAVGVSVSAAFSGSLIDQFSPSAGFVWVAVSAALAYVAVLITAPFLARRESAGAST